MRTRDHSRKPTNMPAAEWEALTDASDRLCDALEGLPVGTAMAAMGNVICGIWHTHGHNLPYHVMAEWLHQVLIHTQAMHQPARGTKH